MSAPCCKRCGHMLVVHGAGRCAVLNCDCPSDDYAWDLTDDPWIDPEPWIIIGNGYEQRLEHPEDNLSKHTPQWEPRAHEQYDAEQAAL